MARDPKVDKVNEVNDVINRIERLEHIRDLPEDEFLVEDGLADQVIQAIGRQINSTQLRKVFHTLKHIQQQVSKRDTEEAFDASRVLSLMPMLAYAVGRGLIPKEFYELLKVLFDKKRLQTNQDFLKAFAFVEAMLAYQKFRNG